MSDSLSAIWCAQECDARFTHTEDLTMKSTRLERRIKRRNMIEYAAGAFCALLFGGAMVASLAKGLPGFAGAFALGLGGIGFVLWNLHKRASLIERTPEQDCRTHLRAQLVRQRDALRSVPLWYVAPLLPGVVSIYVLTGIGASRVTDLATIVSELALPLGGTLLFFAFVCWLNLASAQRISDQIAELDNA